MFKQMCEIIPEQESENFKIVHHTATEEDVRFLKLRDAIQGMSEYEDFGENTYLELRDKQKMFHNIIMSDTPMEFRTNKSFIEHANGKVLIGGLGIGAVLLLIQDKPEVESIIVVEKFKEVIDMVAPHLPLNNKVEIINADILEFKTNEKFDTIYFDIWSEICGDNYADMKKLHRKFRSRLNKDNPKNWMDSWRRIDCMRLDYRDKAYVRNFERINKNIFDEVKAQ